MNALEYFNIRNNLAKIINDSIQCIGTGSTYMLMKELYLELETVLYKEKNILENQQILPNGDDE